MQRALDEMERRRRIQREYNLTHGTTPVSIVQRDGGECRQFDGTMITFNKDKDKPVSIDGRQLRNAATTPSKGACAPAPTR